MWRQPPPWLPTDRPPSYPSPLRPQVLLAADKLRSSSFVGVKDVVITDPAVWSVSHLLQLACAALRLPAPLLPCQPALKLLAVIPSLFGVTHAGALLAEASTHAYFSPLAAEKTLGFAPRAGHAGVQAALGALGARASPLVRLVFPLLAVASALTLNEFMHDGAAKAAAALGAAALLYALFPAPSALRPQPPLVPPVVSGGYPIIGHALSFIKVAPRTRSQNRGQTDETNRADGTGGGTPTSPISLPAPHR